MHKKEIVKELMGYIMNKKVIEDVKRSINSFKYLTPWVISNKYEINMGDAKRILKILELEGLIELVYPDNRNPIYKPKKK